MPPAPPDVHSLYPIAFVGEAATDAPSIPTHSRVLRLPGFERGGWLPEPESNHMDEIEKICALSPNGTAVMIPVR